MTDEPRNQFATFAYGRRYLKRPDRIPVDPVAVPLHDPGTSRTFRTEEGFAVFGGIRDAAPDGWGQYLMYKAMGDRLPSEIDLILASGEHRVGALAFGPTPERPERITPWGDGPAPDEEFTLAELAEAAERAQHVDELDENLRLLPARRLAARVQRRQPKSMSSPGSPNSRSAATVFPNAAWSWRRCSSPPNAASTCPRSISAVC